VVLSLSDLSKKKDEKNMQKIRQMKLRIIRQVRL